MIKKYSPILAHIAIIFIFIAIESSKYLIGKQKVDVLILTLYYIYDISFFYFSSYVYLPYIYRKVSQKLLRVAVSFAAIILYWLMIMPYSAFVQFCKGLPIAISFSPEAVSLVLYRALLILGFAYVLWHNKYMLKIEKERNKERERNLQLENDLLRAQLNPHLVNNALGLVHEHLIEKSPKDAQILEALADITTDAFMKSKLDGTVPLLSEVRTVKSYLQLHKLIKEGNCYLDFTSNVGELESHKIYPFLLIEPVLNLLKYGDLSDKKQPARIEIVIYNGILVLKTWNKKAGQSARSTHHFGMENLKSRLNAYYISKHDLHVIDNQSSFSLTLEIEL